MCPLRATIRTTNTSNQKSHSSHSATLERIDDVDFNNVRPPSSSMIMTLQPPPMTALPSAAFLGKPPQPAITATGSHKKGLEKKKKKKNAPNNNNSNNSAGADSADKKPMRPYTEYNIFFQLERELILKTHNQPSSSPPTTTAAAAAHPTSPSRTVAPGAKREDACCYTDPLPARWSSLTLPSRWYISGQKKPKRKHRKSHGVIGFVQLTKMISERWKNIDDVSKQFCKDMAKKGMVVYKESMRVYNDKHGIAPANGNASSGEGRKTKEAKAKASSKAEKGADKKAKKESTTKKRKVPTTASTAAAATAKKSSSLTTNNNNKKQKKYMSATALQWKQRQILSAAKSALQLPHQQSNQQLSQQSMHQQVVSSATKSGLAQQQQQSAYSFSSMQPTPIMGANSSSACASALPQQHPGAPQHLSAAQHLRNAHHPQQQQPPQASQVQRPFPANNEKIASLLTDDQKSDPSIDVEIDHFLRCIGRDEERDGLNIIDDINATIAKSRNSSSGSLSGGNSLSHTNIAHGLMGQSNASSNSSSAPAPATSTSSSTAPSTSVSSGMPISMSTDADDLLREPFGAFECDMQDDEIMGIWQSLSVDPTATTITPEPSQSSYLHESYSQHSSQQQQQQPRAVSVASTASSSSSSSLQHMYSQQQQQQQPIGGGGNNATVRFPPPLPALPTSASLTLSSNHGNLMQSFDNTANLVCQEVHHNNIAALDKKLGSLNETDFLNSIDDATADDAAHEFNPNMLAGRKA